MVVCEEFKLSNYMNPPECPVDIGGEYYRTDYLDCSEPFVVKEIITKEVKGRTKFYALCEHKDEFSGEMVLEEVYCHYLSPYSQ